MMIIQCDTCWRNIPESDADSVTAFTLDTPVKAVTIHLCSKCVTTRRSFYVDNPMFVEPPEEAKEEQKVSQGS